MVKVHNRQKRYLGITKRIGGIKKKFAKTKSFKSSEAAKKWAEAQKLKNYEIVKPRLGISKKFKIQVKN